jgi:hypothetical protein
MDTYCCFSTLTPTNCNNVGQTFSLCPQVPISAKADPMRWNKEWDKALHPFSASVTPSLICRSDRLDPTATQRLEILENRLLGCQNLAARDHLTTAWLLLEEHDRQAHLPGELENACDESLLGVDSKIGSMVKRQGGAHIGFISNFAMEWARTIYIQFRASGGRPLSIYPTCHHKHSAQDANLPLTIQRNEFFQ